MGGWGASKKEEVNKLFCLASTPDATPAPGTGSTAPFCYKARGIVYSGDERMLMIKQKKQGECAFFPVRCVFCVLFAGVGGCCVRAMLSISIKGRELTRHRAQQEKGKHKSA